MDNYRNDEVLHGSMTRTPSGSEVESAVFHVDMPQTDHLLPEATDSGMRHKLENLKSRGLDKVHDVQQKLQEVPHHLQNRVARVRLAASDKTNALKNSVSTSCSTMKRSLTTKVSTANSNVQSSMRSNPMKWAGIAGGTGFVLGMLGRYAKYRASRPVPDLVIIDASC